MSSPRGRNHAGGHLLKNQNCDCASRLPVAAGRVRRGGVWGALRWVTADEDPGSQVGPLGKVSKLLCS